MPRPDISAARDRLADILCNYAAFTGSEVVLVFDAYMVAGGSGENFNYHNIHIVYTEERETGDVYIERLVSEIGKNENVRVVTSDGMIQLSAVRFGVLRVSAREFEREDRGGERKNYPRNLIIRLDCWRSRFGGGAFVAFNTLKRICILIFE